TGASAQRLGKTGDDQPLQGRCQSAPDRGQSKQADTEQQRLAASKAIRQRTVEKLPQCQPDKIGRQAQLNMLGVGGEELRNRGERREIKINCQRPEGAQATQNE